METKIQKWGNSLALRLPIAFTEQTGIKNGSRVRLSVQEGKIIVNPLQDKEIQLDNMLSQIEPDNLHESIDLGEPMGKELL